MTLRLIGYRYSVYTWAVRMALAEVGRDYDYREANPFDPVEAAALRQDHPFVRVPVLWEGEFRLYETGAVLGYLFPTSDDCEVVARSRQLSGIIDQYVYRPLVRQVFSHAVFRPLQGEVSDPQIVAEGLAAAPQILAALEEIAEEALVLDRCGIGACDCHLAPMIGYFSMADAGQAMLQSYPALAAWFARISQQSSYTGTKPDLTEGRAPA